MHIKPELDIVSWKNDGVALKELLEATVIKKKFP